MRIAVFGENHPFKRQIEHIFNLFKGDNEDLVFRNLIEENYVKLEYIYFNDRVIANGQAEINHQGYYYKHEKLFTKDFTEKDKTKAAKQAVSFVWVKILEELTGKKHDWGILTGIRPTKLYHKLLKYMAFEQVDEHLKNEYLLSSDKINLLGHIVKKQLSVIPDFNNIDEEVSLYIGIPFCPTKCAYCTFPAYAINWHDGSVDQFLNKLMYEIAAIGKWLKQTKRKVTTVYFGGGTPTSINPEQLDAIFGNIQKWVDLKNIREITVEAGRPDTITTEKLNVLRKWNVDRISINPQSFIQDTLNIIGRDHTVKETVEKFKLARKMGMENINMDLIIGLPGETLKELKISLKQIEDLLPESLTVHTLALKRASYLTKNKNEYNLTNGDEIINMMEFAKNWTQEHNYYPYYLYRQKNMLGNLENIGYSLAGKESIYNILIMEEKQTIIGLGSGAVSKIIPPGSDEVLRFPNPKEPKAYINSIETLIDKKIEKLNEVFCM